MKKLALLLVALVLGAAFAQTEIRYWLWDSNQQPAYEQCAAEFTAANPDITVKIEQKGWDDYWTGITTGFVSGTAPDVFTNHLAKYPEFVANGQLVDIQPWVERDGVDTTIYVGGLADLWGKDGARYGLPKDWDTVAIVYNQEMLDAAGVTVEELNNATWNPEDGGTFGEIIAKLSLDANGNNGLSPDFDPSNVVQYGFLQPGTGGGYGQTEWSWAAVSTGWTFNEGLYAESYNYEDPRFIATIQWFADLIEKGFSPPIEEVRNLGANTQFAARTGALTPQGSWMISWFLSNTDFPIGFASLPTGPEGRKSMFNGLADSIWVGSQNQEQAWEWIKFLGSPACQEIVGTYAVVFPAIPSAVDIAVASHQEKGVNVAAFSDLTQTEGATFLFPVTDYAAQITDIMNKAMDRIFIGGEDAATVLPEADAEVDGLF